MSDCRLIAVQLTSYVDNVLAPDQRAAVERHLHECPSCRVVMAHERGGHAVLRDRASRLQEGTLPPGLRSRCESIVRDHERHASRGGFRAIVPGWPRSLVPTALSVILLVFTASAIFSLATRRSDAVLAAQLTADHSKCFKLFVAGDPPSMSAEEVEQMLSQQYGWKIHVPPSTDGLQLIGVRRCLYADGLIPHVMYRSNGEDLSLFVLNGVTRGPSELVTFGHRSQIWTRGTTTFVLVSPSEETARLADATRYMMKEADR
jgi:anti-sigma factor RsiW